MGHRKVSDMEPKQRQAAMAAVSGRGGSAAVGGSAGGAGGFSVDKSLVDENLARQSHAGTSFDPEVRAEQEIERFVAIVRGVYDDLKRYADSDVQKSALQDEMERFQAGFAKKWNDLLASHSRIISPMITGPANFPVQSNQRKMRSYENKAGELTQWRKTSVNSIKRKLKEMGVEAEGGEIQSIRNKIESAQKLQTIMTDANKIVRKKNIDDDGKVRLVVEKTGMSEGEAKKLLTPDFANRLGFAPFQLGNNNANIRRLKDRIVELERRDAMSTADIQFTGGKIVNNTELDRVQIVFDGKPGPDMIKKLKGSGWRWSPRNLAWQRKKTLAAQNSAKQMTEDECDV